MCARPVGDESGGRCAESGRSGEYTVPELSAGSYHVGFLILSQDGTHLDYASQYYNGKPHRSEAEAVSVIAGQTTGEVNAAMLRGGKISGVVTESVTQAPLEGIQVCGDGPPGERLAVTTRCDLTNANGEYTLSPLAAGEYAVEFADPSGSSLDFVPQFSGDQRFYSQATLVPVAAGLTTSDIDAAMEQGGKIIGHVTAAATSAAVEGVEVCALPVDEGTKERCALTNADGEYTLSALRAGDDVLEFGGLSGVNKSYQREFDGGKMSYSEASPVTIEAGRTITGVDATLYLPGERPTTASPGLASPAADFLTAATTTLVTTSLAITPTPLITLMTTKLAVSQNIAPVRVACSRAACEGSIELVRGIAGRHPNGARAAGGKAATGVTGVLATGSFSLTEGSGGVVVLHLTYTGRKALALTKRHPIAAKLIVSVKGGKTTTKSVLAG